MRLSDHQLYHDVQARTMSEGQPPRKRRKVAKAKMFSFHKPKVYRSSTGCCICKAKSSSSRFTDSKKYEDDFLHCFQLEEPRTGEICNACVLLVKRWKKLPSDSGRNWRHVVDARAGPGIKSLTKFKAKNKKKMKEAKDEKFEKIPKKKHVCVKNEKEREQSPLMSDDTEEYVASTGSKGSSRANTPDSGSDAGIGDKSQEMDQKEMEISSFIDLTYFKRKKVCCGTIFVGMMGELMIEPSLFKRCLGCLERERRRAAAATTISSSPPHSSASASPCHSSASTSPEHSVESSNETVVGKPKGFSDSSSDSGYDDSNQGVITEHKKMEQLISQSDKPLGKLQIPATEKIAPMSATLRLKANTVGGAKMPIKLLCKPVALVSSAKLSLSNAGAIPPPAAVDFAMRSPAQRLAN